MAEEDSTEKVCEYLKDHLNVALSVVQRFTEEKQRKSSNKGLQFRQDYLPKVLGIDAAYDDDENEQMLNSEDANAPAEAFTAFTESPANYHITSDPAILGSDLANVPSTSRVVTYLDPSLPTQSREAAFEVLPNDMPLYREIKVHRSLIKNDLMNIFSDKSFEGENVKLEAVIIDSAGKEEKGRGSGVLREVFSCFWNECYDSLMLGVSERVPYVRRDYNRGKWEAIARVLCKGYEACGYFPLLLSKVFLSCCLFGEDSFSKEDLIESFLNFLSPCEANVVAKCMSGNIQCDDEELVEFLSDFDCKRVISSESLQTIIEEIAHKEIIQKPQYISDCWSPIVESLKCKIRDVEALRKIYADRKPTTAKVISLLKATPTAHRREKPFPILRGTLGALKTQNWQPFYVFQRHLTLL